MRKVSYKVKVENLDWGGHQCNLEEVELISQKYFNLLCAIDAKSPENLEEILKLDKIKMLVNECNHLYDSSSFFKYIFNNPAIYSITDRPKFAKQFKAEKEWQKFQIVTSRKLNRKINETLYLTDIKNLFQKKEVLRTCYEKFQLKCSLAELEKCRIDIEFSLDETHNEGKRVAFVTFYKEDKEVLKLVFKPRDAKIDLAAMAVFEEINSRNGNNDLATITPECYPCETA